MNSMNPFPRTVKALRVLGPQALFLYANHQFNLRSGKYKRVLAAGSGEWPGGRIEEIGINLPGGDELRSTLGEEGEKLIAEADEIVGGQVRLFGGEPTPLHWSTQETLRHWSEYRSNQIDGRDIKWVWEPGRFGWGIVLARAYRLSGEAKYAQAFWAQTEAFLEVAPANLGPQWISAQEVALRLISLVFAYQVFAKAPESTKARKERLASALAAHAARIPPTLAYARAQNNNHLLSEALGLFTAGVALSSHARARRWREMGWRWLHYGLRRQIGVDGSYVQHSCNYHRLMLQLALWANTLATHLKQPFPVKSRMRLAAATTWLLGLVDKTSGRVPNLGPNDGAYILPLSTAGFSDYRPVLQAASRTFLGRRSFPPGAVDEMATWLGLEPEGGEEHLHDNLSSPGRPDVMRMPLNRSWGYLRAARFTSRPGHADQLHFDLWWRGLNLAQDAGSYAYNEDPPWDNSLASTVVHNTVTIEGLEQMRRAGRFLWLDWAQARIVEEARAENGRLTQLTAEHNGYRRLGVTHRRIVRHNDRDRWEVHDMLIPRSRARVSSKLRLRLQWLVPDWPWEMEGSSLRLETPHGGVRLTVGTPGAQAAQIQVVRAGELLHGEGPVFPTQGWASPTYGYKVAALSLAVRVEEPLPFTFTSEWVLPG